MADAVQAGRGIVDYPGLYPNATGTVVGNISGSTAIPGPITLAALAAALGSTSYQGTWDASTNTPALVSSVGTNGNYYVVSVAGTTSLNGISDWSVGDWAIFNGTAVAWQKVEGGATTMTVGTTVITGGTTARLLYDNAGVLGETPITVTAAGSMTLPAASVLTINNMIVGAGQWVAWSALTSLYSPVAASLSLRDYSGASIRADLVAEANDILAQRRSTNAQTLRVYNTYTDASNYERVDLTYATNVATLQSVAAGTGTVRNLALIGGGSTGQAAILGGGTSLDVTANVINMYRNGTSNTTLFNASGTSLTSVAQNFFRLTPTINQASGTYNVLDINPTETAIGAGPHYLIRGRIGAGGDVFNVTNGGTLTVAGNLLFTPDGTVDIGNSAALRPRDVNLSRNLSMGGNLTLGATNFQLWSGNIVLRARSSGVITISNSAETDMGRLQFGGTTSSFPSIKRSATALNFRLADDSADAPITAAAATFSGALTVPGVTTAALTSTGTFTSGAGAQVGTLTNAPAAGNPTTWIKIIDNGVTRYIPAW